MDIRDYQAATLPPTNPEPRQIIRTFAGAMEAKLTANDHKPGWRQESWQELWRLLEGEMGELYRALEDYETERGGHGRLNTATARYRAVRLHVLRASLLQEAADVANYALMLADTCFALDVDTKCPLDERGRALAPVEPAPTPTVRMSTMDTREVW